MKKRKKKTTINLLRHTNYQVFNVKFEKQIHFKQTNIKDPFLKVNTNPNKQMEKKNTNKRLFNVTEEGSKYRAQERYLNTQYLLLWTKINQHDSQATTIVFATSQKCSHFTPNCN